MIGLSIGVLLGFIFCTLRTFSKRKMAFRRPSVSVHCRRTRPTTRQILIGGVLGGGLPCLMDLERFYIPELILQSSGWLSIMWTLPKCLNVLDSHTKPQYCERSVSLATAVVRETAT